MICRPQDHLLDNSAHLNIFEIAWMAKRAKRHTTRHERLRNVRLRTRRCFHSLLPPCCPLLLRHASFAHPKNWLATRNLRPLLAVDRLAPQEDLRIARQRFDAVEPTRNFEISSDSTQDRMILHRSIDREHARLACVTIDESATSAPRLAKEIPRSSNATAT